MNPQSPFGNRHTKVTTYSKNKSISTRLSRRIGPAQTTFLAALVLAFTMPVRAETVPATIPFSDLGAKATADYQGDALSVTATADGARLRCGFQKLEAHATREGFWLESTGRGAAGKLRLVATSLSRPSTFNSKTATILPATGTVSVQDKLVRFTRPSLTEEYSVSADGVRQDFVIAAPPAGAGELCVELALSGALAEAAGYGVKIALEGSGRALAYSRLRVEDARGRELTARLEVLSADRLAVSVADASATYPVRIDPTFSDADWVSLNPGMPGADDSVFAIVADSSGNVYFGGRFTFIGTVPANYIAKWDGSSWSALGSGPGGGDFFRGVYALAVIGTDVYAGGNFTMAGGMPATNIAKWDGSSWSALGSGMNAQVSALAVSGTNLYAGGFFTTAGGVTANYIAKWDGSSWSALGSGMSGGLYDTYVRALAVSGNSLYAGGRFTVAGGVSATNMARWDGSAWSALGSGINASVSALVVSGTDLYAGGDSGVARWDGSAWSALGSGTVGGCYSRVYALAVSGTNLYAGGSFTSAGGVSANYIAKWDCSVWTPLGSGMTKYNENACVEVYALGVGGTNLYAGGSFTMAGGVLANYLAKWDGSAWSALGSGMNFPVQALAVSGTDLYAGGYFTMAGEVSANYVAKWDGSAWSALGSGMSHTVTALAAGGANLYAAGEFTLAGGVSAIGIAKWDGSRWSALGAGTSNGMVYVLAVSGSDLYAGGRFNSAGGVTANRIARWDGNEWRSLGLGIGGTSGACEVGVTALAVSGTALYVGGYFPTAGGVTAKSIAKWDGVAWSALGSGMSGSYGALGNCASVYALAVIGTNVYAGGDFITSGGVTANHIAKWNGSTWSALGSGMNYPVYALAVIGTDLYAGGQFTTAGGVSANGIAKWDGSAWSPVGSGVRDGHFPGHYSYVNALAVDGAGHLFVGSSFSLAGTNASPYIAQANVASIPTVLTSAPTQTAEAGATAHLKVQATGEPPPAYHWYFNGTNVLSCASSDLVLTNVLFSQSGTYTVVVTNMCGSVTSTPVMLNVIAAVDRRLVPGVNLMAEAGNFLGLDCSENLDPTANWETMATMTLSNSSQFYFDVSEPLPPQRFYRAWQTGTQGVMPALDLHMVPAITLTGNIGDSLRVDYINAVGPIDAWLTLDTVTLTNTSQLYFDVSVIWQPTRLYRLIPVP